MQINAKLLIAIIGASDSHGSHRPLAAAKIANRLVWHSALLIVRHYGGFFDIGPIVERGKASLPGPVVAETKDAPVT